MPEDANRVPESPNTETVKDEVLQLFDDDVLSADDFDQSPDVVAEDIRSQTAAFNQVVKPAADLSGDIMAASAGAIAGTFDSIEDVETEEDIDGLVDEFEQLTSEDSEVIRTADKILNLLMPLYGNSELSTGDSFTFQDVYNQLREICPETARVYSGVIEVLARANELEDYKSDT